MPNIRILFFCWMLFVSNLISLLAHEESPAVELLSQSSVSWDGAIIESYPSGNPEILVKKITMPVGYTTPIHKHPNPMAVYVIKGEIEIVNEQGDSRKFSENEVLIASVDSWHIGRNIGSVPAEIVTFYMGTIDGEPMRILKSED